VTLYPSKKNVPSLMTLSLALVTMISPADATTVFPTKIGRTMYTCNVDNNKNPYLDCMNSMVFLCNTTSTSFNKITCQTGVNEMFAKMSTLWQEVRKECGAWPFIQNGIRYTGVYPSNRCDSANSNLIANGFYIKNGVRVPVTSGLTDAYVKVLWSNGIMTCGHAATSTPPTIVSLGTSDVCLSSDPARPALTLAKRTFASSQVFHRVIAGRNYTCNVDTNKNPFADCTNTMAEICYRLPSDCRSAVDSMFIQMNSNWQAVRRECGQWQWTDEVKTSFTGSYSSDACATANSNLITNTVYTPKIDGPPIKVYEGLTNSMKLQL